MSRITRTHYPVEKLPEDLREGLTAGGYVCITVEEEPVARPPRTAEELKEQIARVGKSLKRPLTTEEAVDRIRSLRDEWGD